MLSRYTSPQVAELFSEISRIEAWRQVEVAAAAAGAEQGLWSPLLAELVRACPAPTPTQVAEVEATTRHEVVAFLIAWAALMPEDALPIIHRGLTSSDVVDTGLSLQLRSASDLVASRLDELLIALREHAWGHRHTVRLGRTHGQAATVEVWGHRVADFAFAVDRCRHRFAAAAEEMAVAKISGPTGGYHGVSPAVERRVAELLHLRPAEVATQVIMRDRLAHWMSTLSIAVSVCEAVALEVRLGQHHGVAELHEAFGELQAGSSSMPHKRNPIDAERICGLARLVRAQVLPVTEGVALWHERDLSHSSVDRVAIPEVVALTEYILTSTAQLITGLHVDVEAMSNVVNAGSGLARAHLAVGLLCAHGVGWPTAWRLVRDIPISTPPPTPDEFVGQLAALAPDNGTNWFDALAALREPASAGEVHLGSMFEKLRSLPDTLASDHAGYGSAR